MPGSATSVTPTVVQLDVEDIDDDCAKVKFNVTLPRLTIEVQRSDGLAFLGDVLVEVTDVATTDQVGVIRGQTTIPRPVHPNPARCSFNVPVGNYRVKVVPQDPVEAKFRATLTAPAELPATVVGPPVVVSFVLDPPYKWIQFIGHRLKTGAYMGLDGPAGLTVQQNTDAETQAKAFAFSSVLDAVDAKVLAGDLSAPALKSDLKGKNFDQVKSDLPLKGRVGTTANVDLDQAYTKELAGVKRNIARREGAKLDIEKRCAVMVKAIKQADSHPDLPVSPDQ